MNTISYSEKSIILSQVNLNLVKQGFIFIENLDPSTSYVSEIYPLDKIIEAHLGIFKNNLFKTYIKHNLLDFQILFSIGQYFKNWGDVCNYLCHLDYIFELGNKDKYELLSRMSIVNCFEEMINTKKELLLLQNELKDLCNSNYVNTKNHKELIQLKNSVLNFKTSINELSFKSELLLAYFKLKKHLTSELSLEICFN